VQVLLEHSDMVLFFIFSVDVESVEHSDVVLFEIVDELTLTDFLSASS
jgi:hypothetical protein